MLMLTPPTTKSLQIPVLSADRSRKGNTTQKLVDQECRHGSLTSYPTAAPAQRHALKSANSRGTSCLSAPSQGKKQKEMPPHANATTQTAPR